MTRMRCFKFSLGVLFTLLVAAVISHRFGLARRYQPGRPGGLADLDTIAAKFGLYQSDPGFDRFLDLDIDNTIDVADLAIAGRSYGSTRNFHYPRRISNSTNIVNYLSSCIDASDRIHIIWSASSNVF